MSQYFRSFLEEMDVMCSGLKMKRTIQTVISNKSKSQGLSWYGVVSVPLAKITYTSVIAPLMQKCTKTFWSSICCLQDDIFSRDIHVQVNKTMQKPITKGMAIRRGCGCWTGLRWSGLGHCTVAQLKTCLQEEWDKMTPETLHPLVS